MNDSIVLEKHEILAETKFAFDFEGIINKSVNEIYIIDAYTLKFEFVNKAALLNIQFTEEEIASLTPLDIKPLHTEESFKELIDPLIKGEKDKIVFETIHKRKDKSTYDVEVHLNFVEQGRRKFFNAIILDITDKKANRLKNEKTN